MIEFLELFQVLPHVVIPFAASDQYLDPVFVVVRYMWQVAVLAGTAAVATQLVGEQRAEEAQRQSLVVLDETTGLYSRAYFLRALAAEVRRAQRAPGRCTSFSSTSTGSACSTGASASRPATRCSSSSRKRSTEA